MRLIDADGCPDCKDCIIRAYCDYTKRFGAECIVELILKNQPTAYDVDKVVENLDLRRYGEPCEDAYEYGYDEAIYEAIEVARRGGVNEID